MEPERYRFRLLNATNSRFLNLAMFVVLDNGPDGLRGTVDDTLGDEVPFYQIGAEQSLLPNVTKIWTGCKTWLGQGQDAFDINNPPAPPASTAQGCPVTTSGNWDADDASEALLMGPAERADVIVDFTGMAAGTKIAWSIRRRTRRSAASPTSPRHPARPARSWSSPCRGQPYDSR